MNIVSPVWSGSAAPELAYVKPLGSQIVHGHAPTGGGKVMRGDTTVAGVESGVSSPPRGLFQAKRGGAARAMSGARLGCVRLIRQHWAHAKKAPVQVKGRGLPLSFPLKVTDLGWTQQQAAEVRARLTSFEEDWNAPGMEGYDDL